MEEQNPWWTKEKDPHIDLWRKSPVNWMPPILDKFDTSDPGLHFVIGPRQVGKTTMVKLLIDNNVDEKDPYSVFYFSCDEILDHRELGEVLDGYLSLREGRKIKRSLIVLDEISFVNEWWRSIKSRIDRGDLRNDTVIVTGSASMDLLGYVDSFPGRRGSGLDHVMLPLSFSEFCRCVGETNVVSSGISGIDMSVKANSAMGNTLRDLWNTYLVCGGFPRPIIENLSLGRISEFTTRSFIEGIRGDWARAGKKDQYMKQVIRYIVRARGTPVSWNSISGQTSINSPNTTRSYVELLESTFVTKVLDLIGADGRINYRKNRKIHIMDPYILKILSDYSKEPVDVGWMLESTVASLLGRSNEVCYFRNGTECDVVVNDASGQIGFEITRGLKTWRKPWHLRKAHLIDRENVHLFMASI